MRHHATVEKSQYGFYLEGGQVTIEDCSITDNYEFGVYVWGLPTLVLRDSTIGKNGEAGVYGWMTESVVIERNSIDGNGGDGINLWGTSSYEGYLICDNAVTNNKGIGIAIKTYAGESVTIYRNSVQSNMEGISLTYAGSCDGTLCGALYMDDNYVRYNKGCGIRGYCRGSIISCSGNSVGYNNPDFCDADGQECR